MNKAELAIAEKNLSDRWWRLHNLYYIVDKSGRKVLFAPNWAQRQLYKDLWYCNTILKARQLGISTFVCLLFLDACFFNSNVTGGVIAHTREDAEHLFKRIKFAYDNLPEPLRAARAATNDSARELVFNNGSSIRVGTSMRGSTLQFLHISEFGKICAKYPDKAQEIITGSLNTIAPGQYVIIESTAEGREGHFYEMCKQAQALASQGKELSKLDFKFHFFPWWKEPSYRIGSPVIMPQETIDYFGSLEARGIKLDPEQKFWYAARAATQGGDMLREYPSSADEAWESAVDGAYYSRQISQARVEKRIGFVPYDESVPVVTAWDLGYNDSTSIWFAQLIGKEIHFIDYIEGSGESLAHWLGVVKSKPYVFEKHLAPHDIMAHEYTSGMTRQASARKMGITLVPVPRVEIIPGIDAARNILNRCWFDERKCSQGIKCLENYKKLWNDRAGCWSSSPLHNWASHGADAFRTLATGLSLVNRQVDARSLGSRSTMDDTVRYYTRFQSSF
jgi:hypothetical protein